MVLTGHGGQGGERRQDSKLVDAYASVFGNEAWLMNAHISQYSHGNRENHLPVRNRKLLLHRREIDKLQEITREEKGSGADSDQAVHEKREDQVPEIAVAKGKKLYDKREGG